MFVCVFAPSILSESRYKLSNLHNKILSACINDWGAFLVTWCSCHVSMFISFVVSRFFSDMSHKSISYYIANYIGKADNVVVT